MTTHRGVVDYGRHELESARKRFEKLAAFCKAQGLTAEARFYAKSLRALGEKKDEKKTP